MKDEYLSMEYPRTLLIVDDDEINREVLRNIFSAYYDVEEAPDGETGLRYMLKSADRYCALLLDLVMPGMGGMEVLEELCKTAIPDRVPVFIITAETNSSVTKEAYSLGVMDVINKPIVPYVVLKRVNSVVELYQARRRLSERVLRQQRELWEQAEQIDQLNQGMIEALATAIEFRNVESGDHVRHIYSITKYVLEHTQMGRGLDADSIEQIALASILHDVGKIAIPDAILNKPGRLTPDEYEIMKEHSAQGGLLIERIPQLKQNGIYQYAYDIARHHHERWDGKGYPDGLKGEEISVWAQVVSLADVYDALTCSRVYKQAFPREKVISMIKGGECGTFNPELLENFFQVEPQIAKIYENEAAKGVNLDERTQTNTADTGRN